MIAARVSRFLKRIKKKNQTKSEHLAVLQV